MMLRPLALHLCLVGGFQACNGMQGLAEPVAFMNLHGRIQELKGNQGFSSGFQL